MVETFAPSCIKTHAHVAGFVAAKGAAALAVWLLYIQFSGEYDLKGLAGRLLARKKR